MAPDAVALRLKPVLASLHRELNATQVRRSKERTLAERTEELEWLFTVTQQANTASDERQVFVDLLAAATERLESQFGALWVADKHLELECAPDELESASLKATLAATRQHLLNWSQRQRRPLVINSAGAKSGQFAPCKILSVPIVTSTKRVIGVLAFFRSQSAPDFSNRQTFLARHLGRQTASLLEAQFDLMTGLYTRAALEQIHHALPAPPDAPRAVIYVDIDHMHMVNETHGFDLGNELIVRIADVLSSSTLVEGTLAARLSGDRFAAIIPGVDGRGAAEIAERLRAAATRIVLGPAEGAIDVSISCGTADLVDMPQGLARSLAAAEIACKLAKDHGRGRVEVYACEDTSLIRRRGEVEAVSQLRAALRLDRLVLYAQRIAPLRDATAPGGYEVLMRLRNPDGSLIPPGPLIDAAQRYQLLPSVDRWVVQNALRTLAAYKGMLASRGISVSINVSGQSLCDEAFMDLFTQSLQEANLPSGAVTVEITEQAAVTNLARANHFMQRLAGAGCRFALDDFGTGMNSLAQLKSLQISHIKIDGSFVRDVLTSSRSQATVRSIVELARGYGIATVAEYVENAAIADYVRRLGVDYAQGYAFGKPEPLPALLRDLSEDESRRMRKVFLEL